jgi:hypothetical protein
VIDTVNILRVLRERALDAEAHNKRLHDRLRIANGRIGGLQTSNERLREEIKMLIADNELLRAKFVELSDKTLEDLS